MNIDEIKYSLQNLYHRKLRSFLTILSILIGITSIFAIISFGLGIKNYVDTLGDEMGADKLFVMSKGVGAPGTDDTFSLSTDDINFIRKIKGTKEVEGIYMKSSEINFDSTKKYYFAMAYDPKKKEFIEEAFTVGIVKGRGLKTSDLNKIVLGYNYQVANKIFKKAVRIGDKIEIDSNLMEVIGFFEEIGNPSDDANIYMSKKAYEKYYPDKKDEYGYIMIQAEKNVDPEILADKVEEKLRKYKGKEKGKENFYVQTFADMLEMFGSILGIINGVLILIALISMLVATVNIMNTMYTAVLERTKEIGVMKAIGAKNNEILFIFVFESGLLGFIGGCFGILVGYLIAKGGGIAAANAGFSSLQPIFPWYLITGCLFFSFSVGCIAGILPSIQASKLKPVDALRYE
jgi:putative ABC transport system permease protein